MSYAGQVFTIPCSLGGLNGNRNESLIPATDMIAGTRNINLHEGVRRKRGGTAHINSTTIDSGQRIMGIYDYLKPAGTQYVVFATTNGKVWKTSVDVIKTFTGTAKHVHFSQFAGELYACNGYDLPGKWDGATWTDLSAVPTDWTTSKPKYMITHGKGNSTRNWAFGCASTPYNIYVSPDGDGDDFSNTNVTTLNVDTKDGYGLMGGVVFIDKLIMFSKTRPWIIDDADTSVANWGYSEANWEGGVAHQRLIIPTQNDVVCMMENGEIYSAIAAQQYGDYQAASLTRQSFIHNWIKDNVLLSYINDFHGIYDSTMRAIKIFVVRTGKTVVDTCLVYYIDRGPQAGWMIHDNQVNPSGYDASCSASIYVGAGNYQIYTGDYSGFIWGLEQSGRHDQALAFNSGFKTTHLDLGAPRLQKHFRRGRVICDPQGTETINVKVWIDETQQETPSGAWANATVYAVGAIVTSGAKIYECITAHTSATANDQPGSGTNWTVYWIQHRYSMTVATGTKDQTFDIGNTGKRIQIEAYDNTAAEDFIIENVLIDFKVTGARPS